MAKTIRMPSQTDIAKAYSEGASRAPGKYKDGVERTTGFKEAAIAGESLYGAKMQEVVANQTRAKGLEKISDEDWKKGVRDKGAARIGPGMTASAEKRTRNYEPFRAGLEGMSLPDKTTDPMSNIDNRLKPVVAKQVEIKKSIMGL